MSRPRVYTSDNERLRAWRERKRQEEQTPKKQDIPEELAQDGNGRTAQQRLNLAVKQLEFIGECMILKRLCSREEATDMQVLVRMAVRDPDLLEKWQQERAKVPLRGLIPWHED